MAQADCSVEIAEIERRIATGKYPDQNVQIARHMQASLEQMCAFMDEGTRASMMDSVEDVLPVKTEEERQAERREKSAKAREARQARKKAKTEAEKNKPPVSPVVTRVASARSVAAQLFDRDDIMYHTWTWDWDVYQGRLRVLYSSFPDRTQYALPDWKFHVYVAEMTPAGEVAHHLVTSKQANDHFGLALRRGHDEILFHRHIDGPAEGGPATLERWSISSQRMLSSADISDIGPGIDSERWRPARFRVATSDGNVLYETTRGGNNRKERLHYGWFKLSADGRIVGNGTLAGMDDNVGPASWFATNNGGGGLIVNISPVNGTDLISGLTLSANDAAPGNGMTAHVSREKRALIVGSSGGLEFMSTPIERDIMPLGEPNAAQATTMAAIQSQLQGQQKWMDSLTTRFDANRVTSYINVGPHRVEMVKPTSKGFAVLTNVTANRNLKPPVHGPYIIEFDKTGETNRIHLETLARQMKIKLTTFAPAPNGGFYLHGTDQSNADSHIILIDADGNPLARAHTTNAPSVIIEGIMGDDEGVWLYGHAYQNKNIAKAWIERIAF